MSGKITPQRKKTLSLFLLYTGCALCMLLPAFYNSFPIVTPDSGGYISNGWELNVPLERPIAYSVFLRITTLSGLTLWGVIMAQALILVYFLRRVSRKLLGEQYSDRLFFLIVLLLATCTSAGWCCSQLMPDIFTAILLLAIADYYLSPVTKKSTKAFYFFIIWFCIQPHNSNFLIVLLFCLVARLYYVASRKKWFLKKTIFLSWITLFSFISVCFFNLWEGNSFRPSGSTHVFLMARMAENGILDQFLKEYCPTERYSICNYTENTGDRQWDFMWGTKGHLHDAGGWDQGWRKTEKEYNTIIFRTLTRPKYLGLQIYESVEAGLRQVPQLAVNLMPQGEGSAPYTAVQRYFPRELKEYRTSGQQCSAPLSERMGFFNGIILVFLIISTTLTLWLYNKNDKERTQLNWNFLLACIIYWVLANALITATFSTVIDRLQTRVFWLLPFACILFLIKTYAPKSRAGAS